MFIGLFAHFLHAHRQSAAVLKNGNAGTLLFKHHTYESGGMRCHMGLRASTPVTFADRSIHPGTLFAVTISLPAVLRRSRYETSRLVQQKLRPYEAACDQSGQRIPPSP
jgi:hypothetical protein